MTHQSTNINYSGEQITQLMSQIFSKIEPLEIKNVVCRLTTVHPEAYAASECFEDQMRGVGCITDDAVLNSEFIDKTVGEVQVLLFADLNQDLAIVKLLAPHSVEAEKEYAFDLKLAAALRVRAKSQAQAEDLVRQLLETANCNAGFWPNGDPINFEASVDGALSLFEVDGVNLK